jgi:hypothetical protein
MLRVIHKMTLQMPDTGIAEIVTAKLPRNLCKYLELAMYTIQMMKAFPYNFGLLHSRNGSPKGRSPITPN